MKEYTAVFDRENTLLLPPDLCKNWGLVDDYDLWVAVNHGGLLLSKERAKYSVDTIAVFVDTKGFRLHFPAYLVKTAGFRIGFEIAITLADDMVHLQKTNVISLDSPETLNVIWEQKLKKEFDANSKHGVRAILDEEDIYMALVSNEWGPEVIASLMKKPALLDALKNKLKTDDELYSCFCNRLQQFMVDCVFESHREEIESQDNSPSISILEVNPKIIEAITPNPNRFAKFFNLEAKFKDNAQQESEKPKKG